MDKNFVDLEAEKNARVQKEREILENLAEESTKIEEAIITEQEERLEQQGELVEKLNTELQRQRDKITQIKSMRNSSTKLLQKVKILANI